MTDKKQPQEDYAWWGAGLAIGLAIGVSIGVAMDNIGVGIAIGMGIGVAFSVAFSEGAKKNKANGNKGEQSPREPDDPS